MALATLETLRNDAKALSDLEDSAFVSDAQWKTFINNGYKKLYNTLLQLHEDYFIKSVDLGVVGQQEDYELPENFFKIRGVDLLPGGDSTFPITLYPFQWEERNRFRYYQVLIQPLYASIFRYRLMGVNDNGFNVLKIIPVPPNSSTDLLRIWYVPDITPLVDDADMVMTEQLFDEFITVYAAMQAYEKEESTPQELLSRYKDLEKMVVDTASTRRLDQQKRIATVCNDYEGLATGFVGGYGIGMGGSEIF